MASPSGRETEQQQSGPPPTDLVPGTLGDRRLAANSTISAGPRQTIDNPLLTFDDKLARPRTGKTELEEYVLDFTRQSGLEDRYELLLFGARLARDKHEAMIREGSPQKRKGKESGFWKQSKFFRATIMTASLGGMIQGWTQSANNSANIGMARIFELCVIEGDKMTPGCNGDPRTKDLWIFGMLNAMPLLSAAVFGTTIADPLQERYLGRRGSVMISAAITIASTIGASVTHNVEQLAACRIINGIALGAKASIVPIYSAEISPEHIRGAILANWQLADAAGMLLGFLTNLIIVSFINSDKSEDLDRSWRIITNTVLIPAIPLLIMIYLMPESPRYLMKHGKYRRALEAFIMIQTTPLLASRDFMYAHAQLDFESRLMRGKADEHGNLGDRIARSENHLPDSGSERIIQGPGMAGATSQTNSSLAASIRQLGNERNTDARAMSETMDSHQQPSPTGRGNPFEYIELSNVGDGGIGSHLSDASSVDGENGVRQVGKKGNPYFYYIGAAGYFKRLGQLWTERRCRRALLSAGIAMIAQQMTGVNTIAFLGTTVWQNSLRTNSETASDPKPATDATVIAIIGLVWGAFNYIGGLPAYWLSDKYGRSILLAAGLPNMAWSMLVFALIFKISKDDPSRTPLLSIFAVIFTLFYAPTAGTSPFSISAEVFPLVSREVGMAVSVAINLGGAGILVLVFPFLFHEIGATGALSIFAALNVVAFFLVYLLVPETRRRTLEELQYTFDLSTWWHIEYRAVYIRNHFVKNFWKYATGKEVRPPIPFYRWARAKYGGRARQT
ncbi:MFS general substrate transporter [Zopfia rhizophila CBS 207.26]|uniref:MFS general substrate transporter n=1 Tax=Zopfia rhizophila CBS 207.26 TaxID=1314779 RepID=A0A6A6DWR7_9PEZI|nr:MFS general substrate transporter [Zopfia rhizophila CBS 207.26]